VRAIVHVHTDLSTGELSIDEVVRRAREQGIAAVFLAENYLIRIEYGLPPFRSLLGVRREAPSVLARGIERYLDEVAAARQRHPDMVIVPGVEVIPHYRWTGSPLAGNLTIHDLQKNILVFGLETPAALAALPAIGSPATARYSSRSLVEAAPVLLVIPGIHLLARKVSRRRVIGRVAIVRRVRRWGSGGLLIAIGLLALIRGAPFTTESLSPYDDLGIAPYQDLIDAVEQQQGVAMWSFPDAFDRGDEHFLGLRVSRRTEPYGDDLLRSFRYSAFGGLYEDTTRFPEPGGGWDYLLAQYAREERSRPAWLVGESGFHGDGEGKWIGAVETVFPAADRSEAALLEALRRGRAYGVFRPERATAPVLDRFVVTAGSATGGAGDTMRVPRGTPVTVAATIRMSDESARPVRLTLVKSGRIARMWTGATPLAVEHAEPFDGSPTYFRLEARGPETARILSNPVILR
jgi:hypothetical protein